jgi:hypothetical protein
MIGTLAFAAFEASASVTAWISAFPGRNVRILRPRKNFRPKTEFEIDQEIKAYFEEQGTLH